MEGLHLNLVPLRSLHYMMMLNCYSYYCMAFFLDWIQLDLTELDPFLLVIIQCFQMDLQIPFFLYFQLFYFTLQLMNKLLTVDLYRNSHYFHYHELDFHTGQKGVEHELSLLDQVCTLALIPLFLIHLHPWDQKDS